MGNGICKCCTGGSSTVYPYYSDVKALSAQRHELMGLADKVRATKQVLHVSLDCAQAVVVSHAPTAGAIKFHHRRGSSQYRVTSRVLSAIQSDIAAIDKQISGRESPRQVALKTDSSKVTAALETANQTSKDLTIALFTHHHRPSTPLPPTPVVVKSPTSGSDSKTPIKIEVTVAVHAYLNGPPSSRRQQTHKVRGHES